LGLNDMHLSYKKKFMFELLTDGTVEYICKKISEYGIPYGFGGIARLGHGMLPAEYIIAEHYRLGSSMTILSRSFCSTNYDIKEIEELFETGVRQIKEFENGLLNMDKEFYVNNHKVVKDK